ncbi:MAG: hypothetical protein ABF990_11540 [Acetobacter sp.]|uniref:hypothetical protein n=1 Tax=Acetobacter sp. TaxID=440 RepID=UPI0039EB5713
MHKEPDPAWKPQPRAAEAPSGGRMALIGLAACVLVAGAGAHFMGGGKGSGALPAAQESAQAADDANRTGLPLNLIAPEKAAQTLAATDYSADEQASILAAVKRRDARLAVMPIYDASGTGGTVTLISGAWHHVVHLTSTPQTVVLPIAMSGHVDIIPVTDPGPTGIASGVVTLFGPQTLPIVYKGDTLALTVIAQ